MHDGRLTGGAGLPGRLVRTRLVGVIAPTALNVVVGPDGVSVSLPGQGGVVREVGLGDVAAGWASDHLEPGVSVVHPDPDANRALQVLACVGNLATVIDGPGAGARGLVYGKHGAVLVMFERGVLAALAPGERVAIDALGVGQSIGDDVVVHSCDPRLLERLVAGVDQDGRLLVRVAATLSSDTAGAGIGMSAARFDLDILVGDIAAASTGSALRFGDVVAIEGQDHRVMRAPRRDHVAVGVVCHGRSVGGGHGLGLVTLLTGPVDRISLVLDGSATLDAMLEMPWVGRS